MTAPLTLIQGGRNKPEVIEVERRAWDEALAELTVCRAERVTFARSARTACRGALGSLAQVQPDADGAERWLIALLRLAAQEEARAVAAGIEDPEPVAARRAA